MFCWIKNKWKHKQKKYIYFMCTAEWLELWAAEVTLSLDRAAPESNGFLLWKQSNMTWWDMLFRRGAALNELRSRSRSTSHEQPASAEDTVSRFLYEAFRGRKMKKRGRGGGSKETSEYCSHSWVVTSASSCLHVGACTCNCERALPSASRAEGKAGSNMTG